MDYLAGFFNFLSPLFQKAITGLYNGIGSYAWTIILFTVILKLVTLPLDIWQKYSLKKTQLVQLEMAPDLARINERYKNNKNELNQKQMECYKKHGFSPVGGCLPLVINLLLIVFIYASMFTGMNTVSAKITQTQFETFETTYTQVYNNTTGEESEKILAGQTAVVEKYKTDNSTQNSFLWIKSISRKDSKVSVFPNYTEYVKMVGQDNAPSEQSYNNVMSKITTDTKGWNGYYILPVLVVGISFLSTYLTQLQEKKKNKGIAPQQQNILMKVLMPSILGIMCFTTAATFGIYLLSNSVISIIAAFAVDPIVAIILKKHKTKKEEQKPKINYSR